MRRCALKAVLTWCWVVAFGSWGLPALPVAAQDADEQAPEADNTEVEVETEDVDQDSRPEAARGEPSERRRGRDETARVKKLHHLMRKEMVLREEQWTAINRLFEDHLKALAELAKEREAKRQKNAAQIKKLDEELAEARRERDREALRRLRRERGELTGADGSLMRLHRQFQAAVIEELDQEQAEAFRKLSRRVMLGQRQGGNRLREIQILRRALRETDLSPEQREATEKHFAGLKETLAQARGQGEEAIGKVVADLREAVIAELDEEQKAHFEEAEKRARESLERRYDRRPRMGRKGERSRPGAKVHEGGEEPAGEEGQADESANE